MAAYEAAAGPAPEELLARFRREGRPADVATLFDATAPDLFRLALHLVPDAATAEDVLQETFLAVLEHADSYEPGRPAMPWLTGILRNQAGSARRRQARRPEPDRLAVPPPADDPAALAADAEETERLHGAMLRLPEPYRGVALLRWRYGLEPAAIAEVRGEPPGTVRSLLHRALRRLRVEMGALPALMLAFRPERELDGVRRAVCRRAAAKAAATLGATATGAAATSAATVTTGGLLMANKALAGVAGIVVLGVAGWYASRPGTEPIPAPAPNARVAIGDTRPPASVPDPPPRPALDAATVEGLPPPVDLDRCDRDLDLFGVVVDDDGAPVPGATVECVRFPWQRSNMAEVPRSREEETGPRTRAAVDGSFSLRLPRGRLVDLRGTAPGFGQGDFARCQAGERVRLVLRRLGGALLVRTVDEEKRPVAGVRLRLWGRLGVYGGQRYMRTGVTGADGRFEFARLEAGKAYLSAQHDELGQTDWAQPEVPATGTLELELVLPRGRVVSGRVTDAVTGEGLASARVGSNWVMDRPVGADAEGRYRFPGWTGKGTSVLTAAVPGYGTVMRTVPAEGDLDFALERGFRATGRVVDAGGEPVPGARVAAGGAWQDGESHGRDRASAVTDGAGRFVLDGLSPRADHDLVAEADGHGRTARSFGPPDRGGDEKDLGDVALAAPRAIEGRALDAEGSPLVGQSVNLAMLRPADDPQARDPEKTYFQGMGEVRRTDDLGRFRFPDLAPGRHRLFLTVLQSPRVEADVDLPADRDVLDVVLRQQGRSVTLLVTDLAGKPLEGILVTTDAVSAGSAGGAPGRTSVQVVTGADGRAAFRNLPESRYQGVKGLRFSVQPVMGADAPPYAWRMTDPIEPAGQEVKVALKPATMVRGRVLGPDGEAIPGLYVNAFDAAGTGVGSGACGADGNFSMRVPAGEPLTIRIPGHRHVESDKGAPIGQTPYRGEMEGVTAPASDLLLRARRVGLEGVLEVLVLDIEGKPVPDYEVGLMRYNEPQHLGRTDGAGRVRFEGLLEDSWYLAPRTPVPAGAPADTVVPATVEVVPSGQQVVLRLRRGIPLEGVVLHEDGSPAPNATVYAQFRWGSPMARTKSDRDGRFRLLFGEGDEAFVLTASWWDEEERKASSAQLRDVKADRTELVLKLEPAKPR